MKKVLYSYGFGSGYSTWSAESAEEFKFLCEYQPLIRFLEENGGYMPPPEGNDWHGDSYAKLPVIQTLMQEYKERFGKEIWVGGLKKLAIANIPDGERYRITEYDGRESVQIFSDYESLPWVD